METKYYSKDEVIYLYRRAKDKRHQISILAQLTCSDTETIMEILDDAGEFDGKYKVCTQCGKRYPSISVRGHQYYCPACKETRNLIYKKRHQLKMITAKIQQLGLESARIRAELTRLENQDEK